VTELLEFLVRALVEDHGAVVVETLLRTKGIAASGS
jgi:predicted RNA-binding protein YlqC (UPF0109 family)